MLIVLAIFLVNLNFPKNKALVIIFSFLLGFIHDYLQFNNLGETSLILMLLLYVLFLYENKFKAASAYFQFISFGVFAFVYGVLTSNFDIFRVFWFSFLYLFFVSIKFIFAKKI